MKELTNDHGSSVIFLCAGINYKYYSTLTELRRGPGLCGSSCTRRDKRWGKGGKRSQRGEGRVTSDPADRLILSFQRSPLSLLFTSRKERRAGVKKEQAGIMKPVLEGG